MPETPVGNFLRARRELLRPESVGLAAESGRRVPGLRREEVAMLAGMSPDYYLRLEQGKDRNPSEQVLSALSRALRLDAEAESYLFRLVRPSPGREAPSLSDRLDSMVIDNLGLWSHTAAYVVNRCRDVLASNRLASSLHHGLFEPGSNLIYTMFDLDHRPWVIDWEGLAAQALAALRESAPPTDPRLHEIVGDLTIRYPEFSRIWARHDVKANSGGTARILVDEVGMVLFNWQNIEVPGFPDLMITTYFGEAGSEAELALRTLERRLG